MQFLYLLLLTTATFCYDPEILNYTEIFIEKYKLLEEIKNNAYLNPVPNNYNDYLQILDFSGDFYFDIVPIDKWEQEYKLLGRFADKKDRDHLLLNLEVAPFTDKPFFFQNNTEKGPGFCVYKYILFKAKEITISKGKFFMFYIIKAMTVAIAKKTSGNVKVCTTTNSIFKKCIEYSIGEAVEATAIAYANSKIKEQADVYN